MYGFQRCGFSMDRVVSRISVNQLSRSHISPPVVAKCVALLKRYLFRYIPRIETLEQIDLFCVNLIAECNAVTNKKASPWVQSANSQHVASTASINSSSPTSTSAAFASGALVKSLNYVCGLVSRHIPRHSFQSALFAGNSHAKRTITSLRSRLFGSPVSPGGTVSRSSPENKEATNLDITNILGLETINEENNNYIVLDVLKSRWIVDRHQQSWTPSPVMTDSIAKALGIRRSPFHSLIVIPEVDIVRMTRILLTRSP